MDIRKKIQKILDNELTIEWDNDYYLEGTEEAIEKLVKLFKDAREDSDSNIGICKE